jgi:hypothetical protein
MQLLFKFCDLEVDIKEEQARIQAEQEQRQVQLPQAEPGQTGQAHGPDETQQPEESPELRGKIKGNTIGGVGPGGW